MDVDDYLIFLLGEVEIVHHIPGRIRLKFNSSILAGLPKLNGIKKWIQERADQVSAVKDIRLNLFAGSVVIQYDTGLLSPDFWHEVVEEKDVERLKEVVMTLLPEHGF